MKPRRAIALLLFLLIALPAASQGTDTQDVEEPEKSQDFFLIPILETAFSGNVRWRPDWPADIPPDGFSVLQENLSLEKRLPSVIELSSETEKFTVKRDGKGRLIAFPFFLANGYANVEAAYAATDALRNMTISMKNYAAGDDDAQAEEKTWKITFPANFLPFSDLSPGGSFPPLKITSDEDIFHVFIFESPAFLTETWYDGEGEMLVFCKAFINRDDKAWRIRSLQIHGDGGLQTEDYHFDSYGNITEVHFEDKVFSAIYRDSRPSYWMNDLQYELQWDTQGILTVVKAVGEPEDSYIEYRYEYERNVDGNWVRRREIAMRTISDLLVPQPSYSRGIWNRRIVF